MKVNASYKKHILNFKFRAGTSRGVLEQKETWYLILSDTENTVLTGVGEAGPLKGLSPDDVPAFENKLKEVCSFINERKVIEPEILLAEVDLTEFPSVVFALETAWFDLKNKGRRILFENPFSSGKDGIKINGLVWMGEADFMRQQMEEKIREGYECIKLKIGALDFDQECSLLYELRKKFDAQTIMLRVDANGAFAPGEAIYKLKELSRFKIHSIEQPIKAGQWDKMAELSENPPVAIALDEELIGVTGTERKVELLNRIKPQYIILKPTLLGGFKATDEWISLAGRNHIGWWITSALESNIGLNAIAQYTAHLPIDTYQGLGTGKLYFNNISSPLVIEKGTLLYDTSMSWDSIDNLKTGEKMI
ncbi:MAG TPA: o-succinylbenzoate synthase [Cytophagaceae bacterium]